MPTGYTHAVQTGKVTTLRDFALSCARAFGARIDEAHALRRERARLVELIAALLARPDDVTVRERAKDAIGK